MEAAASGGGAGCRDPGALDVDAGADFSRREVSKKTERRPDCEVLWG